MRSLRQWASLPEAVIGVPCGPIVQETAGRSRCVRAIRSLVLVAAKNYALPVGGRSQWCGSRRRSAGTGSGGIWELQASLGPSLHASGGLGHSRLPPASSEDQGQGGASGPLSLGRVLLRLAVRQGRGSEQAGGSLAGGDGQRESARHDRGASGGSVRAGRAVGAQAPGKPALRARRGTAGRASRTARSLAAVDVQRRPLSAYAESVR